MPSVPKVVYLFGSLRSPRVVEVAQALRGVGYEAFDDWYAPGPETDDMWQRYEQARGRTYAEALRGWHARHVFEFDLKHIHRADMGVLVAPAGKSAHLELGYMIGQGKPGYILLDGEPERFDVMLQFAKGIFYTIDELLIALEASDERSTDPRTARDPEIVYRDVSSSNCRWG